MSTIFDGVGGGLTFGGGGYSDDLAGWRFDGGNAAGFNTGADYTPAAPLTGGIVGWAASNQDAIEQARFGQAYPANGQPFDYNAATMGITRLFDTAIKGYTVIKGAQAATYAGQNGLTYTNGQGAIARVGFGGNMLLPLIALGAIAFLIAKD